MKPRPDGSLPLRQQPAIESKPGVGKQPVVRVSRQPQEPIPRRANPHWRSWLVGLLLAVVTILAYKPAWHAGFIWDDDAYVTQNKLLTAPDGLRRIWFSQDSPSQYFPLVYTAFRLEHALWGFKPEGYHWVNLLLHIVNALLVWRLLSRLSVPGAWLTAFLFALHPVQVESVAWVTERKNVMSLFFSLLTLLVWTEFTSRTSGSRRDRWRLYFVALAFYLLALFSKTTACTLPAALLLILWWQQKPIDRSRLLQLSPFVLIGLGMALVTIWWERHHVGTRGEVFNIAPLDRLLIASRAIWFYLGKLLWPANLTFSYPRWDIDPTNVISYLWLGAVILGVVVIMFARRWLGRGPEAALGFYVATLSPLLGFIMLYTFRYTFVADHYQYAACIGPLALVAGGITTALRRPTRDRSFAVAAVSTPLLILLSALTFRQAGAYRDVESLWRDTIAKNPASWLAHSNLGDHLMRQDRIEEAIDHYSQVLKLNPRDVNNLVSIGNALFAARRYNEAMNFYNQALSVNPTNPEAHVNLAVILANAGRLDEAIAHNRKALESNPRHLKALVNLGVCLARAGRFAEALEHYRSALAINPEQPMTHINLAIALEGLGRTNEAATQYALAASQVDKHADALLQQGRVNEAAAQYLEAIRLVPNNAQAHCRLAAILTRAGKLTEARQHLAEALRLKPDYAEAQEQLRALERAK